MFKISCGFLKLIENIVCLWYSLNISCQVERNSETDRIDLFVHGHDWWKIVGVYLRNWHFVYLFSSNSNNRNMGWTNQCSCYRRKDGNSQMVYIHSSTTFIEISLGNGRQIKYLNNWLVAHINVHIKINSNFQSNIVNDFWTIENLIYQILCTNDHHVCHTTFWIRSKF